MEYMTMSPVFYQGQMFYVRLITKLIEAPVYQLYLKLDKPRSESPLESPISVFIPETCCWGWSNAAQSMLIPAKSFSFEMLDVGLGR